MFSVLIAIGAFIKVPVSIVPITLQPLFVVLAGILLEKRVAMISVLLYIIIGLIGLPVFVNGGGIAYVLQPSFGYLIGFLVAAYFIAAFSKNTKNLVQLIIITIIGILIIYSVGISYFAFIQHFYYGVDFTLNWLIYYLFIIYLPGDLLSCFVAGWIGTRLKKYI